MHKPELTAGYLAVWWILRVLSTHALYLRLLILFLLCRSWECQRFALCPALISNSSLGKHYRLVPRLWNIIYIWNTFISIWMILYLFYKVEWCLSVRMKLKISRTPVRWMVLNYRRVHIVCKWVCNCTLLYRPMSCPFRFL